MKNVKDLLVNSRGPRPSRPLNPDFTGRVTRAIAQPQKQLQWWTRYLQIFSFKLVSKPLLALLVLASMAVTGGSVYAVVSNWPQPLAKLRNETVLASGNRIVAVDINNCASDDQPSDGRIKVDGPSTTYYEIKKDSKLTNEQVVEMVQAICEETIVEHALNAIVRQRYGDLGKPGIATKSGVIVKAVTDRTITFGYDPAWFADAEPAWVPSKGEFFHFEAPEDVTFSRLSPDLRVLDSSKVITLTDLRPGDSVKVLYRDEYSPGGEGGSDWYPWSNPDKIVIEAVARTKPGAPAMHFYRLLTSDFVRVEPCKESPTGFCRAYKFIKDDFTPGLKLEP